MGVDVGLRLHVIIQNSEGKVVFIDTRDKFSELDELMNDFNVKACVIDALPETRKSQEFVDRFKGRGFVCYYSGLTEIKDNQWFKKDGQKINTDRTLSLDMWTDRIKKQKAYLPKNLDNYEEFKDHMKSLTRIVTKNAKGKIKAEYLETSADHYYHAGNYSNIAKAIFDNVDEPDVFVL
jgi:hypothetical protein